MIKEKLIVIGRWIAVIPVFVIAYIAIYLIMYYCSRFWADADSWEIKYLLPFFGSLVSGIFSIVYAAKMAPKHKATVAFILLIIMVLVTGGMLFGEIFVVKDKDEHNYINMIGIVISMIGNIMGYQISKNEDELNTY